MKAAGCVAALMLGVVATGCVSAAPGVATRPAASERAADTPAAFTALADALVRHAALHGAWPATLGDLAVPGFAFDPNAVTAYGYAGRPLAVLPDGRRVMLVDRAVSPGGVVWCLVRSPATPPKLPAMAVVALPQSTLRAVSQ